MVVVEHPSGTTLSVRVLPRSSKTLVDGVIDGSLRVRLAAPPVAGAANEALIELIARLCRIPKSDVRILSGEHAKRKRLLLSGMSAAQVRDRLNLEAS